MKRIWNEYRDERIHEPEWHRFEARITADRGVTEDHNTVLRIEKRILHWPGSSEDACEGCRICGRRRQEVIADPVDHAEQEAIRIAIRHADALFEELAEIATEARLTLSPPEPTAIPEP